jgi:tryptophan synthase alpha chain
MELQSKLIIGFGISNRQTFTKACQYANGAIIGSAFIRFLDENGVGKIEDFIGSLLSEG